MHELSLIPKSQEIILCLYKFNDLAIVKEETAAGIWNNFHARIAFKTVTSDCEAVKFDWIIGYNNKRKQKNANNLFFCFVTVHTIQGPIYIIIYIV